MIFSKQIEGETLVMLGTMNPKKESTESEMEMKKNFRSLDPMEDNVAVVGHNRSKIHLVKIEIRLR